MQVIRQTRPRRFDATASAAMWGLQQAITRTTSAMTLMCSTALVIITIPFSSHTHPSESVRYRHTAGLSRRQAVLLLQVQRPVHGHRYCLFIQSG